MNIGDTRTGKYSHKEIYVQCPKCKSFRWMRLWAFNKSKTGTCATCTTTRHGLSKDRLYLIWYYIKRRCYNKNGRNYQRYGAKGVVLCNEWHSFEKFKDWSLSNGYRSDLTIDRIDSKGIYEPSNCQWITRSLNNQKDKYVPINQYDLKGSFVNSFASLKEASKITGVCYQSISNCLNGKYKTAGKSIWKYK